MKFLNIIAEGSSEEAFVKEVMVDYFASRNTFISVRKILTGRNKIENKPAKGGLLKYSQLKNDIIRWMKSDTGGRNVYFTSFIDLYAFPRDKESPYTDEIQTIKKSRDRVKALEDAIKKDIDHPTFIPYVQLHEFETFLLVCPDRLLTMYPDKKNKIEKLKIDIAGIDPEDINGKPQTAPSKRIIKYIPEYEGQKAQVGPLVAGDIGISELRKRCSHFDEWIDKLEHL